MEVMRWISYLCEDSSSLFLSDEGLEWGRAEQGRRGGHQEGAG